MPDQTNQGGTNNPGSKGNINENKDNLSKDGQTGNKNNPGGSGGGNFNKDKSQSGQQGSGFDKGQQGGMKDKDRDSNSGYGGKKI